MIILFQNILFLKEFLACNDCFGLFTKIKKGSGTSFCYTFSTWFFHKNVWYLVLNVWTKIQCYTFFSSQDIRQNVLLSSYLDIWWHHLLKQWPTRRKKDLRLEMQKIEHLENERSFLDEIKSIFHSFWGLSFGEKVKNSRHKL